MTMVATVVDGQIVEALSPQEWAFLRRLREERRLHANGKAQLSWTATKIGADWPPVHEEYE